MILDGRNNFKNVMTSDQTCNWEHFQFLTTPLVSTRIFQPAGRPMDCGKSFPFQQTYLRCSCTSRTARKLCCPSPGSFLRFPASRPGSHTRSCAKGHWAAKILGAFLQSCKILDKTLDLCNHIQMLAIPAFDHSLSTVRSHDSHWP